MNTFNDRQVPARVNFSLRTLFVLVLIVGAFMGGWVANEARHRYIIKDNAQIEFIDGTQTMVIRGVKEDVDVLSDTLSKSMKSGDHSQR
jgi:hypothetical protein